MVDLIILLTSMLVVGICIGGFIVGLLRDRKEAQTQRRIGFI